MLLCLRRGRIEGRVALICLLPPHFLPRMRSTENTVPLEDTRGKQRLHSRGPRPLITRDGYIVRKLRQVDRTVQSQSHLRPGKVLKVAKGLKQPLYRVLDSGVEGVENKEDDRSQTERAHHSILCTQDTRLVFGPSLHEDRGALEEVILAHQPVAGLEETEGLQRPNLISGYVHGDPPDHRLNNRNFRIDKSDRPDAEVSGTGDPCRLAQRIDNPLNPRGALALAEISRHVKITVW
mmetsp:Transcript_22530/g.54957  ORF Transcript_22530/g.54957 Transcript_22530/m.54957 type:complete len:236 (-) Transcript_22530:2264-2971(-)